MKTALLNKPTPAIEECELTFMDRESIQFSEALKQHALYAEALSRAGLNVMVLEVNSESPDAVFVEDVAIILDEIAIITSMGTASRRPEVDSMAEIISKYRDRVHRVLLPATIEGGDVLRVGKKLFVGISSRTNKAGISQLSDIVTPIGYHVIPVEVSGCLHLKTGVTALNDESFLLNSSWIDTSPFDGFQCIEVAHNEPFAANVLRIDENMILNSAYPHTVEKIQNAGFSFDLVNISEFGKAEAGLTCMSLIF